MRQNESNSPVTHIITLIDKKKNMPPSSDCKVQEKHTIVHVIMQTSALRTGSFPANTHFTLT